MRAKLFLSLNLICDYTQFLSENLLHGWHIFERLRFGLVDVLMCALLGRWFLKCRTLRRCEVASVKSRYFGATTDRRGGNTRRSPLNTLFRISYVPASKVTVVKYLGRSGWVLPDTFTHDRFFPAYLTFVHVCMSANCVTFRPTNLLTCTCSVPASNCMCLALLLLL